MVAAPANTGAKMAQPKGCGYKHYWYVNMESPYQWCSTRIWLYFTEIFL